jgi:hypothetical protein
VPNAPFQFGTFSSKIALFRAIIRAAFLCVSTLPAIIKHAECESLLSFFLPGETSHLVLALINIKN